MNTRISAAWLAVVAGAGLSWQTGLAANYSTHPLRNVQGKVYDFAPAIAWMANEPSSHPPLSGGSASRQAWEMAKQRHALEGQTWSRFLVRGSVREQLPEGLLIEVPVTNTVVTGVARQGRVTSPTYGSQQTTRQVLLKNPPTDGVFLPVFAVPGGSGYVNGQAVPAFDYGIPVITNVPASSSFTSSRLGVPSSPRASADYAFEGLTVQVTPQDEARWRFTYRLRVRNRGTETALSPMRVEFLDEDGAVVQTTLTPLSSIPPGTLSIVTGSATIPSSRADRVSQYRVLPE